MIKSEVYEREPTLPQSVVVTVFVELVKQPTQAKARVQDKDVPDGYIKWKGKLVKNFKKFKKVLIYIMSCLSLSLTHTHTHYSLSHPRISHCLYVHLYVHI